MIQILLFIWIIAMANTLSKTNRELDATVEMVATLREEVDNLNLFINNNFDLGQQAPQPDPATTQRLQDKA